MKRTAAVTRRVRVPGRSILATALTGGMLIAATACGTSDDGQSGDSLHTVDSAYGEVEVPEDPQRVVAVSYDTPWQLKSLGVTPVGTQDYSDYAQGFTDEQMDFVESAEPVGTFFDLDIEAVAAADPDVIVGDVLEVDEDIYAKLSEIAPTVIVEGETRGDWKAIVGDIATAVDAEDALAETKATYEQRLAEIQDTYRDVLDEYTFASIGPMADSANFYINYPSGILGAVYEEVGMRTASSVPTGEFSKGWEEYSTENIGSLLGDADVVLVPVLADGTVDPVMQEIIDNTLFRQLKAAQDGHVVEVDGLVTDYESATAYLDVIEDTILSPLEA
ncbi:ABC transporter substrate-binding protein [Corynebacterium glyciniphilum]|uniref:ABC transporter substrate-binding protein n=1 Tax=Corynebacterium glyciniphilum TaxID=1404244 RepID=UPI002353A757